ncbi:hypothetical protein [Vitiosangium sp. GDMCC 1.1324]|uniref:hypothetical protein n=1 Tax=Vitiosangium sp. (strain GDMCC 1.1324) TaxID=2138576 RepID=UPI000D342DB4|nr:hypothetical protein [Vitiosangium sp. GDMCC 1.1324]PTL76131.1 hypothetical protein DAT35_51085 [Vitiosangium sp. GDMCC 1.1324]
MKPSPPGSQPRSPLALRAIHGIVFGGFTAICLAADWPEVEHLIRTQLQPFHSGPSPRLELLVAMLAAVVGMAVVLVRFMRGHSARLHWSLLILGALVLSLWGNREGVGVGRSAHSANLKILQVAQELHRRMADTMQAQGAAPEDVGSWQAALEQVSQGAPTPVRTRSFEPLPFLVRKVDSPDALPVDAPPGTLLLHVLEGGVAYELHPVGVSLSGESWPLREPGGEPIVFRGAFNPDLPQHPDENAHDAR